MIPILYDVGETAFTSNGLGRLADCITCSVTEEKNGIYECQFTYPITGEMFKEIQEGRIIAVIHDDRHDIQPFDIYSRSAPINGVVTFYAHHVSYRLGNVILRPMSANTCAAALAAIPSNTYNPCPFTFWTDKVATATWRNEVPNAVKAILAGQQGSILDVYGKGEYEFDRFNVKLHVDRGTDNGVAIRYGVNLTDITQDYDVSSVYTAVVPYWLGTEGELVTLPEGILSREGMAVVPVPLDLSDEWEEQPTVEQLRAKASSKLESSEAWLPKENIKISFVDLAHTVEYRDVSALQQVSLCDKVSVYYKDLDVAAVKFKVVRMVYNVLTEMYNEIELGDARTTLAQTIASQFADAVSDLPTNTQVRSMLTNAVDNATQQITGAAGGFVRFMYDANGHMTEILIMDTDNVETAQKVWRWNSGGLGFSSNGYGGPYGTAITQDGSIVADYITSGTMDANLLRAGIITSRLGGSYWNLDTGELVISGMNATDIVDNVGTSVTGIDIEYAQNQDSAIAPTTGWSTVAPPWAAGWYIWQRTKTTTPTGVEYSEPTCISGRDGSSATPGLNQATLYLYTRAASQPSAPSNSMTYTFATGALSNIPAGWSRTIPTGADPCWVTSAAAISTDTAVTIPANVWQDPVMMAANGAAIDHVDDYFATNDSVIPPSTEEFFQLGELYPWVDNNGNIITDNNGVAIAFMITEPPVPTKDKPYVWTFQRTTYTDGTVLDSTKIIVAVLGADGVGVEDIVEEYYLSTSDRTPTGGSWSTNQPQWREGTYLWTRTRVTWTDGVVTTTEPILAKALNSANETAAAASAKADSASAREQTIYRSVVSGTISLPANTTWVTNSANAQNVWTTTRPVYSSAYPVLFVATQRQSVEQRSGTTCSCTTPVIDQTTTVIDGGHITTGTIDAGVVNVTNIKAGNITSGTISADLIGANSITSGKIAAGAITAEKIAANAVSADKLSAGVITSISNAQSTADGAASAAGTAQSTANGANGREQTIYRSAPAGTTSMAGTTTWVSSTTDTQNSWQARRPTYNSSYPVLFVATQRQTVAQTSGTTCSCTTPVIDNTTTVIDGGRIITGSVTSGKIAANAITADKIAAQAISADKLSVGVQNSIDDAQSTANGANSRSQTIYRSAPAGTSSMDANTTWVSSTGDTQNVWRARRPTYNSDFPVLFVATQRQTVAQKNSGTTCSCTTPVIDKTTTVIDGGHITTGSIDASLITTGEMSANHIRGGTLQLGGQGNTNGKLSVLNASGTNVGTWDNTGISSKSITADDYIYIDGNANSLLKIPTSNSRNYYISISKDGFQGLIRAQNEYVDGTTTGSGISDTTIRFGVSQSSASGVKASALYMEGTNNDYVAITPAQIAMRSRRTRPSIVLDCRGLSVTGSNGRISSYQDGANIVGNLTVEGTKSRAVATDQYSDRLLYCYETPSPMFGDIGEGTISDDGLCYVWLDPVFAQTIATDQYQVFLQRYGEGDCWVRERRGGCFVVQGTPGLTFGWEIKAKQKDFSQMRLEKNMDAFNPPTQTYGADAAQHIDDIRKDREAV